MNRRHTLPANILCVAILWPMIIMYIVIHIISFLHPCFFSYTNKIYFLSISCLLYFFYSIFYFIFHVPFYLWNCSHEFQSQGTLYIIPKNILVILNKAIFSIIHFFHYSIYIYKYICKHRDNSLFILLHLLTLNSTKCI